jgi:hypothetical protein
MSKSYFILFKNKNCTIYNNSFHSFHLGFIYILNSVIMSMRVGAWTCTRTQSISVLLVTGNDICFLYFYLMTSDGSGQRFFFFLNWAWGQVVSNSKDGCALLNIEEIFWIPRCMFQFLYASYAPTYLCMHIHLAVSPFRLQCPK